MSEKLPVKVTDPENELAQRPKARTLNDCMAVERTVLANERTLLAYIRTSLAVLVVAVTAIKFFTSQGMLILGYALIVAGVICLTLGLMRFTEMYNRINDLGRCKTAPSAKDTDED